MELVNGRPTDTQGRLDKEIRVYDFLDSLGVSYQRIDHEAAMTMEACRGNRPDAGGDDLQESAFMQPTGDTVLFTDASGG